MENGKLRMGNGNDEWDAETLLETLPRTWAETEDYSDDLTMDPEQDIAGPLVIGISLTRNQFKKADDSLASDETANSENLPDDVANEELDKQQRVVVIGDSDFVSDNYIGQSGNMDFAMNVINWLTREDNFIVIPNKTNGFQYFELSKTMQIIIGFGFLLVIPLGLLLTGLIIWMRRRKR